MAVTEQPRGPKLASWIYGKLFHNYVWRSIFRSGYPSTPRNQMLVGPEQVAGSRLPIQSLP